MPKEIIQPWLKRGTHQKWKTQCSWNVVLFRIFKDVLQIFFRLHLIFSNYMMHWECSWSYAARYQICLTRLMRAPKIFYHSYLSFVSFHPQKIDTFSFVHPANFKAWKIISLDRHFYAPIFKEEIKKLFFSLSPKCSLLWCGYHWRRDIWNLCCMAVTS